MADNYERLQARALDNVEQAWGAANAKKPDSEARLLAIAQIQAMLAVGAALQEVAQAIRGRR